MNFEEVDDEPKVDEGYDPKLNMLKNILVKSPRARHVSELHIIMPMLKNVSFFKE